MRLSISLRLLIFCLLPYAGLRAEKPNVLLILADDLGWSDAGCYGGEIATPNLDALAKGGLQFRAFYNSARCSPTRASILTGLHPHQAGFPNLSGTLPGNAATLPEVLKPAGYRSYMVGKWHLNDRNPPTARGFDEFYGMLGGYNSCWQEAPFYTRWPAGREKRAYAKDGFYSTDVFGDYALDFLVDGKKAGAPWFMYLAFNAPHFPLHAPEADIAKYEALYFEKGWDRIREERLARQKALGLVPADLMLTPRAVMPENKFNKQTGWAGKEIPAWDTLPEDRRRDLARRMAVYAAMVACMDRAIGRVTDELKKSGQFDNTLIFFLSDNGACAEWDPYGFDKNSGPQNILHTGDDLKNVGGPDSYISYGSGWAHACDTPWRLFKHYAHEGGTRTPCIVSWPAGLTAHGICETPGYITDFMPTICEVTGAVYPKEQAGRAILPQEGKSLAPALRGEPVGQRRIFIEHEGNRSVRDGEWKLVAVEGQSWELYNVAKDPAEMQDLAGAQPGRVQELAAAWQEWAERCQVVRKKESAGPVATPEIAGKRLSLSCTVETRARSGVILAQGGNQLGYALWLKEGKPVFTVRTGGQVANAFSPQELGLRAVVAARLEGDGTMALMVDGKEVATGKASGVIPKQPQDGLSVGEDARSAVGDYEAPNRLEGTVTEVKVEASAVTSTASQPPNIIFVLADDMGVGDTSSYGGKIASTPQLERLAREGVRFTQYYSASPICSPSRCGLITGQYPARWRITSFLHERVENRKCEQVDFLDAAAPSLPRVLQAAGYATAHIGKWHIGGGRDVADAPKFAAYGYDLGLGTYESPEPAAELGLKTLPWGPDETREPQQVPRHERTRWMVDRTIDFLKKNAGRPCFVNLWFDDTHTPWVPAGAVKEKDGGRANLKKVTGEMDRQIGRLMDAVPENTVLVFASDNGALPAFKGERNNGMRGSKLSLYEGGIRLPFIVRWPGHAPAGKVDEATVIHAVDMLPTLASIAGAALPKDFAGDGLDVSAALKGAPLARKGPLFWEYGRNDTAFKYPAAPDRSPNVAVRDGRWKLLVNADGTGAELYDLAADPNETTNVATAQADRAATLTAAALAWRRSLPKL